MLLTIMKEDVLTRSLISIWVFVNNLCIVLTDGHANNLMFLMVLMRKSGCREEWTCKGQNMWDGVNEETESGDYSTYSRKRVLTAVPTTLALT